MRFFKKILDVFHFVFCFIKKYQLFYNIGEMIEFLKITNLALMDEAQLEDYLNKLLEQYSAEPPAEQPKPDL